MREIEVKTRVEDMAGFAALLAGAGHVISEPITQRDQVYGMPGADGGTNQRLPWLRIRTETKGGATRYLFTLKKSITNQLDSIEHETEVTDAAELEQIILHSGFEPYSDIVKTRQKTKVGDIEICLDHVEQLGTFVEAEKLTGDDANYEAVIAELWAILETYGALRANEVTDGYDVMMKKLAAK